MSDININQLSEREIKELAKTCQSKLDEISKEKERRRKFKQDYHMRDYKFEYRFDDHDFHTYIMNAIEHKISLTSEEIKDIERRSYEVKPIEYFKIYMCPECGEFGLYAHGNNSKYSIYCGCCGYKHNTKECYSVYAWKSFHNYLIRNNFLSKDDKFITVSDAKGYKYEQIGNDD